MQDVSELSNRQIFYWTQFIFSVLTFKYFSFTVLEMWWLDIKWFKMLFTIWKVLIPIILLSSNARCFWAELSNRLIFYWTQFVTQSKRLCSKSFLLPDIRVTLFSLFLYHFNWLGSKHTTLANVRITITLFGSLPDSCIWTWNVFPWISGFCLSFLSLFFFFFFGWGGGGGGMRGSDQNYSKRQHFEKLYLQTSLKNFAYIYAKTVLIYFYA